MTDFWETFHGNFIYLQSFCPQSAGVLMEISDLGFELRPHVEYDNINASTTRLLSVLPILYKVIIMG